ncbi:protein of unknown function [Paraburkholderia kururiensis]
MRRTRSYIETISSSESAVRRRQRSGRMASSGRRGAGVVGVGVGRLLAAVVRAFMAVSIGEWLARDKRGKPAGRPVLRASARFVGKAGRAESCTQYGFWPSVRLYGLSDSWWVNCAGKPSGAGTAPAERAAPTVADAAQRRT